MNGMETYHGHVRTPADAIILFEACRIGLLPRVQRRLSEKERQSIKSGSVFVWDEREAGMRRWTDGKSWSASRVSGSFLTYREMEGKRGGSSFDKNASNRDGIGGEGDSDGGPDGYRYKPDGLMKQSFSITTNQGQHLHLISYFSRSSTAASGLMQPSSDPQLRHIRPEKGMYPDSTVHEQSNIPAVTRGPMGSPGYTHAPHQPPYGRPYYPHWAPPSPMHTPPPHHAYSPYYQHPHAGYPGMHYPPPPTSYGAPPGMTAFDRPPPPMGNTGLPPPPPGPYHQPHHSYSGNYPPPPPTYNSNAYAGYQPPPLQAPPYPAAQQSQHEQRSPTTEQSQQQAQQPTPAGSDANKSEDKASSPKPADSQATAGAPAPASSGQTIPSISAMLNGSGDGGPPQRTSSRSPGGTARAALHDIPTSKLGFEASRDVQTIRNLDKTTFKQNFV
ncbi:cAMP-independent regulatory protein pac2 [Pseudocercospora fuligena]|uniref:cAMP-independent regulatory protein pac2 n=1 Tax=Pseudocercospora fuligena TaxID=685502 RepID=A0A8H6RU91_9PEZI|nr:cAMP-independent regulatory protein pac2 [Pseudocercospora fuligena]